MFDIERTRKLIGQQMREFRRKYNDGGASQEEIVKEVRRQNRSMTQGHLSKIENGEAAFPIEHFIVLLNVYRVSPNEAFGIAPGVLLPDAVAELNGILEDAAPERRRLYLGLLRILVDSEKQQRKENEERWRSLLETAKLFGGDELTAAISELAGVDFDPANLLDAPADDGGERPLRKLNGAALFSRG